MEGSWYVVDGQESLAGYLWELIFIWLINQLRITRKGNHVCDDLNSKKLSLNLNNNNVLQNLLV